MKNEFRGIVFLHCPGHEKPMDRPCLNLQPLAVDCAVSLHVNMSSKMIIRSCSSSIRTLINRHFRLTVAPTVLQTETPGSIYNWQYILPNSTVSETVYFARGVGNDAAGYSMLKEAARGGRKENFDEQSISEDEDDDDFEMDNSELDGDDSEFDSDDDSENDSDDS
ncbi:hypothetical protein LXL04_016499 [Taraxacum kok-saghyz]